MRGEKDKATIPSNIEAVVVDVATHERLPYLAEHIQERVNQISRDTFRKPGSKQRVVIEILSDKEFIREMWKFLFADGSIPINRNVENN